MDYYQTREFWNMNAADIKNLINEEIRNILKEDAFRRIVITSKKAKEITKEMQAFIKRPEMKKDYPVKLTIKPGVIPDTVVVDIAGEGATVMGTKLGDLAKKLDKTATIKTKKEIKRVPVKESKSNKKSLKEGYAWERSERKFGDPLPTLDSIRSAYQAKQKMTEVGAFPIAPGKMKALKRNKVYSILDAGTDEWNEYIYVGEIGQGSTVGNPGDHMFSTVDAPGVYIFVSLSEEDLKTMIKEP